jgi:excisionase family DNA binding protein
VRALVTEPTLTRAQLLTADQLAERWQVPAAHVYRLAREGRIPVVRLGRYRRFRADAIERFELAADGDSSYDGSL